MFILCIFDEDEGGCAGDYGRERGCRSQELLYWCFELTTPQSYNRYPISHLCINSLY